MVIYTWSRFDADNYAHDHPLYRITEQQLFTIWRIVHEEGIRCS